MSARPKPRGLGHLVLNVRDLEKSVRFYTEYRRPRALRLHRRSDGLPALPEEHHNLALARIPGDVPHRDELYVPGRPGLEHFSFRLESLAEIEAAAAQLQAAGIEIVRGIGKHGPGENLFLVFKDPDGNFVEFYAEMVQITRRQAVSAAGLGQQSRCLRSVALRALPRAAARLGAEGVTAAAPPVRPGVGRRAWRRFVDPASCSRCSRWLGEVGRHLPHQAVPAAAAVEGARDGVGEPRRPVPRSWITTLEIVQGFGWAMVAGIASRWRFTHPTSRRTSTR